MKQKNQLDISAFKNCRILVIGDLMIDEYLWGEVDRISPEAPVPVVNVNRNDYTLGGSGNVVNNLAALGAKVFVVGVIGTRTNGSRLLRKFKKLNVDTQGIIRETDRPTTIKTRIIATNQHVLRIDRETRKEISFQTTRALRNTVLKKIADIDVVIISDYGKGLVTVPLVEDIVKSANKHDKITIVDPKGLDFKKYAGVTILTPNKKEAALAAGIEIIDETSFTKAAKAIKKTTGIGNLLITCGKDGMVLFEKNRKPYRIETQARQVFDVSGAGDTVVAVTGLALAAGFPLQKAVAFANTAAGIVVGKVGTATVTARELETALNS